MPKADFIRLLKAPKGLRRTFEVGRVDEEARTIEIAFSSDVDLERWPGMVEKLSHEKGAVNLDRLNNGAPLLWNHDFDAVIGVVESARIDPDGKGRATVRFSKNAMAEEKWNDVKDGILRKVSVGYRVNTVEEGETVEAESGVACLYSVTRWTPYEISLVSVPADDSVGVGRSVSNTQNLRIIMTTEELIALLTERGITVPADATNEQLRKLLSDSMAERSADTKPPKTVSVDEDAIRAAGAKAERDRRTTIMEAGRAYGYEAEAEDAANGGMSVDDFRALLRKKTGERNNSIANASGPLGLSDKDTKRFSFMRMIACMADPLNKKTRDEASFEMEVSEAQKKRVAAFKKDSRGQFYIPTDVLAMPMHPNGNRAASAMSLGVSAGNGTGAQLVQTSILGMSFIELLRNRTVLMQLGTPMGGLLGKISIPKQASKGNAFWLAEGDNVEQSDFSFSTVSLDAKTVGCYTDITRQMMRQPSVDVEALVRRDIALSMAEAIDYAGFYGDPATDTNAPKGLANQTGINAVNFATAGAPTYAELVEMETLIAQGNADIESMAYIANPSFRGYAKTTLKFPNVPSGTIWEPGNQVNGYGSQITNQIAAADVFFGNFADILIGLWGGLELMTDPYSNSLSGALRIVAMQDADIAIRRAESFTLGRHTGA